MADEADRAAQDTEALLEKRVERIRQEATHRKLLPMGCCYYCESAVNASQLFCDGDCANDWEAQEVARRRNHGR